MSGGELINPNPVVHERRSDGNRKVGPLTLLLETLAQLCPWQYHNMASLLLLLKALILNWVFSTSRFDLQKKSRQLHSEDDEREPIDNLEIFEHIRDITDPEHPYTLEQLNVVAEDQIRVDDTKGHVM